MRAQVAYARWLISFGMELEDKKLRPRGSPPREGVLADLAHQLCAFPAHAPTCKFATFYRCAPGQPHVLYLFRRAYTGGSTWRIGCVRTHLQGCVLQVRGLNRR